MVLPLALTGTVVSSPWSRSAAKVCLSMRWKIGISATQVAPIGHLEELAVFGLKGVRRV
jgi:hypothetical protein